MAHKAIRTREAPARTSARNPASMVRKPAELLEAVKAAAVVKALAAVKAAAKVVAGRAVAAAPVVASQGSKKAKTKIKMTKENHPTTARRAPTLSSDLRSDRTFATSLHPNQNR